jgi:flavodoxin
MKTLITFYSRTGTTKKVAEALAQKLGAEIEEIKDTVPRGGAKGYLLSGRDATLRRLTKIEPLKFNPGDFELVIIGTPIWSWNLSVPIRTYLQQQKNNFPKVAFFATMGGSGDERASEEAEKIINQKFSAHLALTTKEVIKDDYINKLDKFVAEINS